jgi:hypothetical protein
MSLPSAFNASLVDPLGTMIAMATGRFRDATAAELRPEIDLWQSALERAQYVWLTSDTYQMIPWNHPLDGYFTRHFRLIGFTGPSHHLPLRPAGRPLRPDLARPPPPE